MAKSNRKISRKSRGNRNNLYFRNRREYYRRRKISRSLKQFHRNRRIIQEQKKEIQEVAKRFRTQVTYNGGYGIFIRAVVINGKQTIAELEHTIEAFIDENPMLEHLQFDTEGIEEETPIADNEDKNFRDGKVYIEQSIRGRVSIF